jgi:hypothetical protein
MAREFGVSERALKKAHKERRILEHTAEWGRIIARQVPSVPCSCSCVYCCGARFCGATGVFLLSLQMCRNLLKISAADIEFGQKFWEDNTPELNCIGRRGIKRHRIGRGNYVEHKKHVYRGSMVEMWENLERQHPDYCKRVKIRSFFKMKPYCTPPSPPAIRSHCIDALHKVRY